jgi:P4 family phage/plasmid primase-like protien
MSTSSNHWESRELLEVRNTRGALSEPKSKARPESATDDGDDGAADGSFREAPDDPHRLARIYLRWRGLSGSWALRFYRDEFQVWSGTCYRHLSGSELRAEVTNAIKQEFDRFVRHLPPSDKGKPPTTSKVTRGLVGNVIQALQGLVIVASDLDQPCWLDRPGGSVGRTIALANGLVNVDGLLAGDRNVLERHSPEWFSTVCVQYEFQPDAQCPRFLAFIEEILEHDQERITLLRQWFGYLLAGDTSLQKFLILVGEGSNGKTVLLAVLTALLGESNVSSIPLEIFGQRFQLTPALGKLANLVPELGVIDRVAEGFLKAFVAGDRMHFDRKGLPGIDARPTARLVLATNTLPPFADRSGGVWRRLMVLPFQVTIPPERQDPQLTATLLGELSGIFNWAVAGWGQLRGGRFIEPKVCRELLEEYRMDSNPAQTFLLDEVRSRRGSSIPCTEVYRRYRGWCDEHGHKPVPDTQFGKDVFRAFPRVKRRKATGGRRARRPYLYAGLAWISS